jgi:hypothetical protein
MTKKSRFELVRLSPEQFTKARKDGAKWDTERKRVYFEEIVPDAWAEFVDYENVDTTDAAWWTKASGIEERGEGLGLYPVAFGPECWQSFRVAVLDCAKAGGERLPPEAWPEYQDSVRVADWRDALGVRVAPSRRPQVLKRVDSMEDEEMRARSISAYLDELPKLMALMPGLKPSGATWFDAELWERLSEHVGGARLWAKRIIDGVASGQISTEERRAKLAWDALAAEREWARGGCAGPAPRIPDAGDTWQRVGEVIGRKL